MITSRGQNCTEAVATALKCNFDHSIKILQFLFILHKAATKVHRKAQKNADKCRQHNKLTLFMEILF